jgi:hypothetical protein
LLICRPPILLRHGIYRDSSTELSMHKCSVAELLWTARPLVSIGTNLLLDLLDFRLLGRCRRSIALAETLATAAISPLDEAGSQVVAPAIAADKFLRSGASDCFHLETFCLGLLSSSVLADLFSRRPRRIPLGTLRRSLGGLIQDLGLASVGRFRRIHSPCFS